MDTPTQHPNARRTQVKRDAEKARLVEAFRKTPIVQLACQAAGILSRSSYYRWRAEDPEFVKACDEAIGEGVELVSDLAESKLIQAIKEQNYSAISFWLRHRHPAYAEKLQINAKVETADKALTPEQEAVIRRAIELAQTPSYVRPQPTEPPAVPAGNESDGHP